MTGLAARFDRAQVEAEPIAPPAETASFSSADAYREQHRLIALRLARGEQAVGIKLGFTSRAKMAQMGMHEGIAGRLTNAMRVPDRSSISVAPFIAPRVEPEIAFRLSRDVDPADPREDLTLAIDAVAPALDIIDSRVIDYAFDHGAVVADNASAGGFAVGNWHDIDPVAIDNLAVALLVDGKRLAVGSTAAILGDPRRALSMLQRLAAAHSLPLREGDIILAGAATASVPMVAGYIETQVSGLGSVGFEVLGE